MKTKLQNGSSTAIWFGLVVSTILIWALIVPLLIAILIESGSIALVVALTVVRSRSILTLFSASLLRSISGTVSALVVETSVIVLVGMASYLK